MYVKQLVKKDDGTLSWVPAVSAYCKVWQLGPRTIKCQIDKQRQWEHLWLRYVPFWICRLQVVFAGTFHDD